MANEKKKRKFSILQSLQVKYAITYIAVIAAVLVLLNTYPILVSQDLIFKSKQTSLQSQTAVVASALAGLESLTTGGVEHTYINGLSYSRIIIGTKNKIIALVSGRPGRRLDAEEAR